MNQEKQMFQEKKMLQAKKMRQAKKMQIVTILKLRLNGLKTMASKFQFQVMIQLQRLMFMIMPGKIL